MTEAPSHPPAQADREKSSGYRTVVHPAWLQRIPDVSQITDLPPEANVALNEMRHITSFKLPCKHHTWLRALDVIFLWMLRVQGNLSFTERLRNAVYNLFVIAITRLDNKALSGKLCPPHFTVKTFTNLVNQRSHPPSAART